MRFPGRASWIPGVSLAVDQHKEPQHEEHSILSMKAQDTLAGERHGVASVGATGSANLL